MTIPRRLAPEAYAAGVLAGDRALLAKTVTLVESNRDDDRRNQPDHRTFEVQALLQLHRPPPTNTHAPTGTLTTGLSIATMRPMRS